MYEFKINGWRNGDNECIDAEMWSKSNIDSNYRRLYHGSPLPLRYICINTSYKSF